MSDLSSLSDADLTALYQQQQNPLAGMSNADLTALHAKQNIGVGEDVAKSIPGSLQRLVSGTLGTPGDIGSLASTGAAAIGVPENVRSGIAGIARRFPLTAPFTGPGSEQVQSAIEGVTGKQYDPQTIPGKLSRTAIELAPAVFGGPEALAAKAVMRVAAPAAAMTAAGEASDNPYAQLAAGVGASMLAHRAVTPSTAKTALTGTDLEAAANQSYQDVHNMGLELKAKPVEALATQIEQKLVNKGVTPRNAASVYDALDTLKNPPPGAVITSHGFDNLRKEMVQATQSPDGSLRTGGRTVISALDDYLANLPSSHVIKGDAQAAAVKFKEARENYKAMIRMQIAEGKNDLGELNAATAHSGQNVDNAMRQSFKQMIRPDKYGKTLAQKEGFNAPETAAINQLARGGIINNSLRWVGKLAPTDVVKIGLHGAMGHATGGATIPLSLAALAAKKIADKTTLNRTQSLLDMIASRSPAAQRLAMLQGSSVLPSTGIPGLYFNNPHYVRPGISPRQSGLLSGLIFPTQASGGLLQLGTQPQ